MIIFENWIILEYQKLRNTQMEFILEKLIEIFDVWPNKIILFIFSFKYIKQILENRLRI